MHNWRLLLLAFLAVLQPIASFTERNLVDGREQRCDRNSLLRDTRLSYGTHRFDKLSEDRRISRAEIREDRRYEVRKGDVVFTRPSVDRRLVEFRSERDTRSLLSLEPARFARAEHRRDRVTNSRRERFSAIREDRARRERDDHRISSRAISRTLQDRDTTGERLSRNVELRQHDRENRASAFNRVSRDQSRLARSPTEFRRESRRYRDTSGEFSRIQETRETREILQRARIDVARNVISNNRQDRRVVRERAEARRARTMDNDSERRTTMEERRSLDRRTRETVEDRRASVRSISVDRVRNVREDSRFNLQARDEGQRNQFRREVERRDFSRLQRDNERASRDRVMSVRRDLRERTAEERRNAPESMERFQTAEMRSARLERVDSRRDSRFNDRRLQSRSRDETPESRRVESRRMIDRELHNRDVTLDRRDRRSMERRETRDLKRDNRMIRSVDNRREITAYLDENRVAKNRDNRLIDSRFRSNTDSFRTRDIFASVRKIKSDPESTTLNWQNVMYTLQGLYLCHALIQLLTRTKSTKKSRSVWWSAPQSAIKVD